MITTNQFTLGQSSYVTGSYTGDTTKVALEINGEKKQTINVPKGGTYQYYAANFIHSDTDTVYMIAYDETGVELDRKKVNVYSTTGDLTVNPFVLEKDHYITGSYTGDVKKVAVLLDSEKGQTITVQEDGSYSYYIGNKLQSGLHTAWMIAYDEVGKELNRKQIELVHYVTTGSISTTPFVLEKDSYVTGTYEGDVAKIALEVDGEMRQSIAVPKNSPNYRYYLDKRNELQTGEHEVNIVAYDAAGKELDRKPVELTHYITTGSISTTPFVLEKDSYVTGTYEGDVAKIALEVDGEMRQSIAVPKNSPNYRYYLDKRNELQTGEHEVNIIAYDTAGKELDRKPVELTHYITSGSLSVNPFVLGKDSYVTGSYTGDVKKVAIEINGERGQVITVPADGNYKYYIRGLQATDEKIFMVAYDLSGKELDRIELPLSVTE
ncbi:immunoglobulin-like domain-containing protein [Listeria aquatica]|uniref:Bacterial Ig domain-containing protein n=1 Tax=Listeria aquatica FSL S10-1188 TaxID=1265818 RepID=W7BLW9_9LIST|nr:immunoglobulin-like domain-containing protein [Listeria aquatica]EUJ20963.1 hypothetical protein MAQA_03206 [Listeria aquatica FSL S10-1188]